MIAFHEFRIPDIISRGARGGAERRTQIIELASGDEERNASRANSSSRYDIAYGIRRADKLASVMVFYEARNGRLHWFRYKNWADYKSCLPPQPVAATDQPIATGNAAVTTLTWTTGANAGRITKVLAHGLDGSIATLTLLKAPVRRRQIPILIFFAELLNALGFATNATLPAWWQGWPVRIHVQRWRDDLGLSGDQIIATATATRTDHPNSPDELKALDRFMECAAQRDALAAAAIANGKKAKRPIKCEVKLPLSDDEKAAFYAKMVNADGHLPQSVISNTIRDAMLARGLVTPERLCQRGVR